MICKAVYGLKAEDMNNQVFEKKGWKTKSSQTINNKQKQISIIKTFYQK